jgi:glutamate-ammonia-ligase adenylyltransferase
MLAVSLRAFADYQRNEAWSWEHMALARARPVFGSAEARTMGDALIREILHRPYDPAKLLNDAVEMRSEIERHKPPSGPLDVKLGPGGLVDLEFAVHLLQLSKKAGLDPRLEAAVEQLRDAGLVEENIVEAQKLLTRMLIIIRLVAPETTNPSPESCELMALACGAADWDELLARHQAARQSVTALWDRIKGGQLT